MTGRGASGGVLQRALPQISPNCGHGHHTRCRGLAGTSLCACPCHVLGHAGNPPRRPAEGRDPHPAPGVPANIPELIAVRPRTAATAAGTGRAAVASEPRNIRGPVRAATPTGPDHEERSSSMATRTYPNPPDPDDVSPELAAALQRAADLERVKAFPCGGVCSTMLWPARSFVCSAYNSAIDGLCTRHWGHDGPHVECTAEAHKVKTWGRKAA